MKYHSKNNQFAHKNAAGLSLIETVTALVILSIISTGVFVVIDRCINAASDTALKVQAFEVARENMEKLLGRESVQEKLEYGISERYPDIQWETRVEPFNDSASNRMWARAVCLAEYTDAMGETQQVNMTHLLTDLSATEAQRVLEREEELRRMEMEEGVDPDTPADDDQTGEIPTDTDPDETPPDETSPTDDMQRPPDMDPELWEMIRQLLGS